MKPRRRRRLTHRVTIRLTQAEQDRLEDLCQHTGRSLSDLTREALRILQEQQPCDS